MYEQPFEGSLPSPRPAIAPTDIARHVQEAHRLRSEAVTRSFVGVARAIRGGLGIVAGPISRWLGGTAPVKLARSALIHDRERRRVRRELASYTEAELLSDLRLTPMDIDGVATEAADDHLAAIRRGTRRSAANGMSAAYAGG